MRENMTTQELDLSTLLIRVHEAPVKNANDEITMSEEALKQQAEVVRDSIVAVDYETVRGTCGDERERIGLKSGEAIVEPRPSVFGGPNIYGLYASELAGVFKGSDSTPAERLHQVTRDLNRNGVRSGGHEHCAAAAGFGTVLANGVSNADAVRKYAQENMNNYDDSLMSEVLSNAQALVEARTYDGWDGEAALTSELGDEANEAIEKLDDVPHKGRTIVRQTRSGYTVDQTKVHKVSGGEDSFVWDDAFAERIENAAASGPESTHVKRLMEHAREFVLVGVALSVPNPELHQINVS